MTRLLYDRQLGATVRLSHESNVVPCAVARAVVDPSVMPDELDLAGLPRVRLAEVGGGVEVYHPRPDGKMAVYVVLGSEK